MYISVTAHKEGSGLRNIPIDDILFLETSQNRILVHTADAVYYVANTLERWTSALQSAGYHFETVDRGYLADLSKVDHIDERWGKLYFNDKADGPAKSCNAARSNFRRIVRRIEDLRQS